MEATAADMPQAYHRFNNYAQKASDKAARHGLAAFRPPEIWAYERIRSITDQTPAADQETAELREFQRRVNSMVPIPPGVADVGDYPPGGK
jgi:hypothetical protein